MIPDDDLSTEVLKIARRADFHYHQNDLYMFMTKTKTDTHTLTTQLCETPYILPICSNVTVISKSFRVSFDIEIGRYTTIWGRYKRQKKVKCGVTCLWSLTVSKKNAVFYLPM